MSLFPFSLPMNVLELEKPVISFLSLSFQKEECCVFKSRHHSFSMLLKITIAIHIEEEYIQYLGKTNFPEVIMLGGDGGRLGENYGSGVDGIRDEIMMEEGW